MQKDKTETKVRLERIPLDAIMFSKDLEIRAEIDKDTIEDYAEAMQEGSEFPPVTICRVDGVDYLADGWHRYQAAQRIGAVGIEAYVHDGNMGKALWLALESNKRHGRRLTIADKRAATTKAIERWPEMSTRSIADLVGVSAPFVADIRAKVETSTPSTRKGKDGREYAAQKSVANQNNEEQAKDADESADTDRESNATESNWQRDRDTMTDFEDAAQQVVSGLKAMDALTPPLNKRSVFAKVAKDLSEAFAKQAVKWGAQ